MTTTIDLSLLPAPDVVEALSFEIIRDAMLVDLAVRDSSLSNLPTSDPAYKLLEVAAYREMLIRQDFNNRSQGLLLALSTGSDLDHIGVTYYYTARLVIDPGDPTAIPPIDPVYESDDDYRSRCLLAGDVYSTAGPEAAYIYHVKSASGNVKNVGVTSPAPGQVVVSVLSNIGDGTADAALLASVTAALDDNVRPMTDQVTVQSTVIVNYTINATLTIYPGFDANTLLQNAITSVTAWTVKQQMNGIDITLTLLKAALAVQGVMDVVLNNTIGTDITANIVIDKTQATYCTGITVVVGGVNE
jgi:phage-related baseplate assembly protein